MDAQGRKPVQFLRRHRLEVRGRRVARCGQGRSLVPLRLLLPGSVQRLNARMQRPLRAHTLSRLASTLCDWSMASQNISRTSKEPEAWHWVNGLFPIHNLSDWKPR